MYTSEERRIFFDNTIVKLESLSLVEGVVQIGSGVVGFSDEFSDIDLMVATPRVEDAVMVKNTVHQLFEEFNPVYIKEKQFSKEIFLLIIFLENQLEFNVSIVPKELLSVKSPLWKVIVDKTGLVSEKMNIEQEELEKVPVKYEVGFDVQFEFVYCAMSLDKALRRNNIIYALNMLETMRTYTLHLQVMNEKKKLHQFKAYDTLDTAFKNEYLTTYPEKNSIGSLKKSSEKLKVLFNKVVNQSSVFTMDSDLQQLLKISFV
ncbi:hypothetical protein QOZ98_003149 [Planomicrobium stackebrandtii]|uniref:Polymerase nucleotidyl transferase domain-containing protein n=1 Tax=Planomicrobium stackebrandtii TaxID=253160 RepID=A0ABU0GZU5_9BACL|nr:aminoglycoside 6-adenylyltransferase [Planomicrobium stackebrandtii]MDQ0430311.1 hypothetical protein [Planomicrobium stackebrandtii]